MSYFDALFSGMKWKTIASVMVSALAILKIAILTRYLAKADFGYSALTSSILSFINLFSDFGLSVAILHRRTISNVAHSSLYWLGMLTSMAIYAVLWLLTPGLSIYFQEPLLRELLPVAGINLIVSSIGTQYKTLALKALQYRHLAVVGIVGSLAAFFTAIYLARLGWGVWALIYSTLISSLITQVLLFIRGNKSNRLHFSFSIAVVKPFWNIGKYSVGGEMINYFTREIDVLLIGKLGGASLLGAYSLAKQLTQKPGQLINNIIVGASLPILPRLQEDLEKLKLNFLKMVQLISTINGLIYGLFFIFAGEIVRVLYGPAYDSLIHICRILAIFYYLRMVIRFNANLIIATGKTSLSLILNAITFPLTGLAVWFGFQWELAGIAWGQVAMMVLLLFISWYLVLNRLLKVSLLQYLQNIWPNYQAFRDVLVRVKNKLM